MCKKAFQKLALERCAFYTSQLAALKHMSKESVDNTDNMNCYFRIVQSLRSEIGLLESLLEEDL